jgi:hypothetical protein
MSRFLRLVLFGQGSYYLLTGLWPLINISSFLAVTGPKADLWLVRMVGCLASVIGASLLTAAIYRRLPLEILILAVGSAVSFAAIDLVYALSGRISPVYLFDAVVQLILIVLVGIGWRGSYSST